MKYILTENKMMNVYYKFLDELCKDLETEVDPHNPRDVYYVKDGKVFMLYDTKNELLNISYEEVIAPFEQMFSELFTSSREIRMIIKNWAKDRYSLTVDGTYTVIEFEYKPKK